MRRRYEKQRILAEINITPFTDVILVLLIIFMIATPLLLESNIQIKLPQTTSAPNIKEGDQVYITVTDEALLYLDKDLVTKKELKEKMAKIRETKPDIGVLLRVDKLVRFKDVVDILDTLNELGVKNLNIAGLPKLGN
jgi:biopolymer transport protein ExbD